MLCDRYQNLSHLQKVEFIGQLVHACQSDNDLLKMGEKIILLAQQKGVLDGVKIMPPNDETPYDNSTNLS